MLGDGGGDQPLPPHAWEGGLITDILQEVWPDDCITKVVVLSPGKAILFFGRHSKNEGLPYCKARGVEFGFGGPFNWVMRSAQIEASRKTVQEGCCAIPKAVVEMKKWPECLGDHVGGQSTQKLQLQTMTLRSGCEA